MYLSTQHVPSIFPGTANNTSASQTDRNPCPERGLSRSTSLVSCFQKCSQGITHITCKNSGRQTPFHSHFTNKETNTEKLKILTKKKKNHKPGSRHPGRDEPGARLSISRPRLTAKAPNLNILHKNPNPTHSYANKCRLQIDSQHNTAC